MERKRSTKVVVEAFDCLGTLIARWEDELVRWDRAQAEMDRIAKAMRKCEPQTHRIHIWKGLTTWEDLQLLGAVCYRY